MRVLKTLIVPSILLTALLAFAPAASAAPNATIGSVTRNRCVVSVPVAFEDAGTYWMNVWDDGLLINSQSFVSTGSDTHTFIWTITSNFIYGPGGLPGVNIYIEEAEGLAAVVTYDTEIEFDFPGSDDIATTCAAPPVQPQSWITTPATVTTVTTAPTAPTTSTTVGQTTTTTTAIAPSTTVVPGANKPTTTNTPSTRPGSVRPATGARPVSARPTFTG